MICDNPLRDLDGLVLLAWQLARQGGECFLVPMYTQGFDVPALDPDVVVANYVRRNNVDLLRRYRNRGIRVAILDTEGAVSRSANSYAQMVGMTGCRDFVDLYLVWGREQREAFLSAGVMPADRVKATGCPRYDYCAGKWRPAMAESGEDPGYLLVNTNYPIVNPRFSADTQREVRSWKRVGFDSGLADQVAVDARMAFENVIAVCHRLASDFPEQRFVLRPHPFESIEAYRVLEDHPNFVVRQRGAVLPWLRDAKLLIHQNCLTAVEAVMLDREPVSLEWFNTPALKMPSPTRVSRPAASYDELRDMVAVAVTGGSESPDESIRQARREILATQYADADGNAALRAADLLAGLCATDSALPRSGRGISLRGRAVSAMRSTLGYRGFDRLRALLGRGSTEQFAAKSFSLDQVVDALARIERVAGNPEQPTVVAERAKAKGRRSSGLAIRVAAPG